MVARLGVSRYQQEDVRHQCETKLPEGWVNLPLVKILGGSFAASGVQPESRGSRCTLGRLLFPTEAKGTAPSDFTGNQGFTSKEKEAECLAEERQKCWVVLEECLLPSLPLSPPALESELELLLAESVQGARWCQALGVTA